LPASGILNHFKLSLMKTSQERPPLKVVVQQVNNNTTAWMGHRLADDNEIVAGQTFTCPSEVELDTIEIFSALVIKPGHANMTIHSFDPATKKWGPVLHSSSVVIDKKDTERWISFPQTGLQLHKGDTYGFQIHSNDMYLGLGEAAGSHSQPPFIGGQEWTSTTGNQPDKYYSYLSLAFRVGARA